MKYSVFVKNGEVLPIEKAMLPFETVESMYGFGVYETLKLRNGIVYFLPEHCERLFHSASSLDLKHTFTYEDMASHVGLLVAAIGEPSANIKVLLMGKTENTADLYLFPSAPYYPNRAWYRDGVAVQTFVYERWMPQVKSLNMLPSYYMYKKAQATGCYDALLIDTHANVREGTRTNFYAMKGNHIVSPPKKDVLEGVTMKTLEKVIANGDYTIEYKEIPHTSLRDYDSLFLTSTSTKIIPIAKVDDRDIAISQSLYDLITLYTQRLDACRGEFERLS